MCNKKFSVSIYSPSFHKFNIVFTDHPSTFFLGFPYYTRTLYNFLGTETFVFWPQGSDHRSEYLHY